MQNILETLFVQRLSLAVAPQYLREPIDLVIGLDLNGPVIYGLLQIHALPF